MTTTVSITFDDGSTEMIELSSSAEEAIRFKFNPSGLADVNRLKALSGALISACEAIRDGDPAKDREMAVAITNAQTASMWAVLGATKGLP